MPTKEGSNFSHLKPNGLVSYQVEEFVELVQSEHPKLENKAGFQKLLHGTLAKVAGSKPRLTKSQAGAIRDAGLGDKGWSHAAKRDLNRMSSG